MCRIRLTMISGPPCISSRRKLKDPSVTSSYCALTFATNFISPAAYVSAGGASAIGCDHRCALHVLRLERHRHSAWGRGPVARSPPWPAPPHRGTRPRRPWRARRVRVPCASTSRAGPTHLVHAGRHRAFEQRSEALEVAHLDLDLAADHVAEQDALGVLLVPAVVGLDLQLASSRRTSGRSSVRASARARARPSRSPPSAPRRGWVCAPRPRASRTPCPARR